MSDINRYIISVIFILSLQACSDSTQPDEIEPELQFTKISPADDSNVPDPIKVLYLDDAAIITLWAVMEDSSDLLYDVDLPKDFIVNIYNGLIHIYNNREMLDSLTYIFRYDLHILNRARVHRISTRVDSTVDWVGNWLEGEIHTDNDEINRFITEYNLYIESYYIPPPPDLPLVVLESEIHINTYALAEKLEVIDGIVSAMNIIGSANVDLSAFDTGSDWEFEYFYSWGACNLNPVDCQFKHYWVVKVNPKGDVSLLEDYGDEIP